MTSGRRVIVHYSAADFALGKQKMFQENEPESERRKIIYVLTDPGINCLAQLSASFSVGMKQPPAESSVIPLGDDIIGFILSQRRETAEIDFKATLDTGKESDFANIAKDIFAMANYGGGYLIIGFKETETGSYEPIGLPPTFHIDKQNCKRNLTLTATRPWRLTIEKPQQT